MIGSRHQTATLRRVASTIVFSHHPLTPNWQRTPSNISKTSIWFNVNPTGISEQTTQCISIVILFVLFTFTNLSYRRYHRPSGHDKIFVMNLLPNCQKTYTIIYKGKMKKSRTFLFFFSNENPHHTSPNSEESFVSLRTLFNYQITYTII